MSRRSRRNGPVKVLTSNDRELLLAAGHVGTVSTEQAHRHCGVNRDRLQRLEDSGLIEVKSSVVKGKTVETVILTRKGQEYTREQLGITHLYVRNGRQVGHDLKLAEAYFSLSDEERATWKNGNQVEAERGGSADVRGLVDAVIERDGQRVAIEVITKSYGPQELVEKQEYATHMLGAAIKFI